MQRVEDVMTKEVVSCYMDDSLNRAAQIMWERDCGSVPVIDLKARVIGIITDRDACMAAYTQGRGLSDLTVASACSHTVKTCMKDDSLAQAEALMNRAQVHRLPVVDRDGTLVGMLSLSAIVRQRAG
jgi:CBS domain-containing protein